MNYIIRRLASGVLLILALTLITYVVFFTIPANPTCLVLDCGPGNHTTPAEFAAARHRLGLDRPVLVQYGHFLWGVVRHGSFGESYTRRYTISSALEQAVPPTASIVLGGALLLILLAFPLGTLSALRANRLLDRVVLTFSLLGIAFHPFVVGLLLQQVFAVDLGIAPKWSYCSLTGSSSTCHGVTAWAYHLYLPWLVFALFFLPLYTRMFRSRMIDTLGEPYVRTARSKGASEFRVLSRHVLRNAALPILPMLAMDVGTAVTTAIYVEAIFRIGGLGTLAVNALSGNAGSYDLPTIVGIVFVVACAVVVLNLVADLSMVALDPRITGRGGKYRPFRLDTGRLNRRRIAVVAVTSLAVAGGGAVAAIVPGRSGGGSHSVGAYMVGAKRVSSGWRDRMRLPGTGSTGMIVRIQSVLVGPRGWAVRATLQNETGQDLALSPGSSVSPRLAGFSLQFPSKDEFGRRTYVALQARAFEPALPTALSTSASSWTVTFAGPGKLPRGTTIFVGLGPFSAITAPQPITLVTNTSFKLQ